MFSLQCTITKTPLFSVVIPTLDSARTIRKCLDSAYLLKIPEDCTLEVLIIDGGSADGTIEIAKTYPVRIITELGKGEAPRIIAAFVNQKVNMWLFWTAMQSPQKNGLLRDLKFVKMILQQQQFTSKTWLPAIQAIFKSASTLCSPKAEVKPTARYICGARWKK